MAHRRRPRHPAPRRQHRHQHRRPPGLHPFGTQQGTTGSLRTATDRGFLNKTEDDTTGLTALGARYYDPTIARFISPGPLLDQRTPNYEQAQARRISARSDQRAHSGAHSSGSPRDSPGQSSVRLPTISPHIGSFAQAGAVRVQSWYYWSTLV
ncbi:RHS repeat-associated core domain-containing protein [Kitasatospora sp. NPDC050467]|uniref:RHS repeat-associated core domain-containing protein n=1 Tax=unclassified Kitasatospora TaxID=2633591 RepID=UPI00378AE5F2